MLKTIKDSGVAQFISQTKQRMSAKVYLEPTSDNWGEYAANKPVRAEVIDVRARERSGQANNGTSVKSFWLLPENEQPSLADVVYPLSVTQEGRSEFYVKP